MSAVYLIIAIVAIEIFLVFFECSQEDLQELYSLSYQHFQFGSLRNRA